MNSNSNLPPSGKKLPLEFSGKIPLIVTQVVIGEDAVEPLYKCLCRDGSYVNIPLSSFVNEENN